MPANALDRSLRFLREIRKLDPGMPSQRAEVFLLVIAHPGITMAEIEEVTGISQSSSSRHASDLGKWSRTKKPGLGLIEKVTDPEDWRLYRLYPTIKGKMVAKEILEIIDPDFVLETKTANEDGIKRID